MVHLRTGFVSTCQNEAWNKTWTDMNRLQNHLKVRYNLDIAWYCHSFIIFLLFSHISITVLSSWMRTKHRTLWGSGPGCASLGLHQNSAKGATVGSHLRGFLEEKLGCPVTTYIDQLRIIRAAWPAKCLSSKKSWKIMVVVFPELDPEQIIANSFFFFFRARLPSQLLGLKVPQLHPAESMQVFRDVLQHPLGHLWFVGIVYDFMIFIYFYGVYTCLYMDSIGFYDIWWIS